MVLKINHKLNRMVFINKGHPIEFMVDFFQTIMDHFGPLKPINPILNILRPFFYPLGPFWTFWDHTCLVFNKPFLPDCDALSYIFSFLLLPFKARWPHNQILGWQPLIRVNTTFIMTTHRMKSIQQYIPTGYFQILFTNTYGVQLYMLYQSS